MIVGGDVWFLWALPPFCMDEMLRLVASGERKTVELMAEIGMLGRRAEKEVEPGNSGLGKYSEFLLYIIYCLRVEVGTIHN